MITILFDSLRNDYRHHFEEAYPNWSYGSFKTVETLTSPVIASWATGKTPEELGIPRSVEAFYTSIDKDKIDDTIFDHFESHISMGRLIGPEGHCAMPPARRGKFKILPPIPWNAVSNYDIDILNYVGQKWSMVNPFWVDYIHWHSFTTHSPFNSVTGEGAKECVEIVNTDRLIRRLPMEERHAWYLKGVNNAIAMLRGIVEICGNKETIIVFADHGEMLGEHDIYGHGVGMLDYEEANTVPIFINKDEKIPDNISHLNMKDWIVEMYKKYEVNNPEYQSYKKRKMEGNL